MGVDDVLAWIAIGASASLAGMIWPFRRGTLGVLVNLAAGAAGAVAFALASFLFVHAPRSSPLRLAFAALGAIIALLAAHGAWNLDVRNRKRLLGAPRRTE